jgi:hypothetical protein
VEEKLLGQALHKVSIKEKLLYYPLQEQKKNMTSCQVRAFNKKEISGLKHDKLQPER